MGASKRAATGSRTVGRASLPEQARLESHLVVDAKITTASMADARHAKLKSRTTHPNARPTFRCLPDRVRGIPMALDSRPLAAESPDARLHDHENPNFLPIRHRLRPE